MHEAKVNTISIELPLSDKNIASADPEQTVGAAVAPRISPLEQSYRPFDESRMSAALVTAEAAALAQWELTEPAASVDAELQRENITHLCTAMLWLCSWWDSHQDAAVRAIDGKASAEIHDHFVDGAIFARSTARGMKLELDEQRIKNYRWGNSAQILRMVVAMPAAAERRTA